MMCAIALATGIGPPSVWVGEDDATLATVLELLAQADEE